MSNGTIETALEIACKYIKELEAKYEFSVAQYVELSEKYKLAVSRKRKKADSPNARREGAAVEVKSKPKLEKAGSSITKAGGFDAIVADKVAEEVTRWEDDASLS